MDWTASESATWLSVSPASGTNTGTITVTPVDHRPGGRDLHDRRHASTATGATGSPKTITGDADGRSAHAAGAVGLADDARVHRHGGRHEPRGQDGARSPTPAAARSTSPRPTTPRGSRVTPASATAPATLTATPTITGLAAGTYTATVTVTATTAGATGSPKTIAVTLTVEPGGLGQPGRRLGLRRDDRHDRRRRLGPEQHRHDHRRHARRGGQVRRRAELQRHEQLGDGGRREQPRPHDGHDARGVGAADRPRARCGAA